MKFELHSHTKYSHCSSLEPKNLLKAAYKMKLDGIAISDHNTIKGALAAKNLNKNKDFKVIVAEEVDDTEYNADVLCYNISEEIRPCGLFDIIDNVKKQGGFIVIAHPYRSILFNNMLSLPLKELKGKIDAIEVINGRTFSWQNKKALNAANILNLGKSAGSDAHFSFEIGRCGVICDGDVFKAIRNGKNNVFGNSNVGLFGNVVSILPRVFQINLVQ